MNDAQTHYICRIVTYFYNKINVSARVNNSASVHVVVTCLYFFRGYLLHDSVDDTVLVLSSVSYQIYFNTNTHGRVTDIEPPIFAFHPAAPWIGQLVTNWANNLIIQKSKYLENLTY